MTPKLKVPRNRQSNDVRIGRVSGGYYDAPTPETNDTDIQHLTDEFEEKRGGTGRRDPKLQDQEGSVYVRRAG